MPDPISLLATSGNAVLATIRRNGRPQLSNVVYAWDGSVVHVSLTTDRAKTANLRRDPRASLEVTTPDLWQYVVLDCDATLSPVAEHVDDATVDSLVELYCSIAGEHPEWPVFRQSMVDERRLLLTLTPTHHYGMVR